jgi:hypothetical protein
VAQRCRDLTAHLEAILLVDCDEPESPADGWDADREIYAHGWRALSYGERLPARNRAIEQRARLALVGEDEARAVLVSDQLEAWISGENAEQRASRPMLAKSRSQSISPSTGLPYRSR